MPAARPYIKGAAELARTMRRIGSMPFVEFQLGTALYAEGEKIMTESKRIVPVDTGNLRASGHVFPPLVSAGSTMTVGLRYGGTAAKYALSVHENPRSGRTGGITPSGRKRKRYAATGRWKYLEEPVTRALPGLMARLGRELSFGIAKLGAKGRRR